MYSFCNERAEVLAAAGRDLAARALACNLLPGTAHYGWHGTALGSIFRPVDAEAKELPKNTMISISRLNHAVLYVRSLDRSVEFYRDVLGMHEISRMNGAMAFLRAAGSSNHHDLGLAAVGERAPGQAPGSVGLYHLAWEVSRIEDLATVRAELARRGALTGASDHGATKSIYGVDPDGNEFEIMWLLPRAEWGEYEREAPTRPLQLERELQRYGGRTPE